MKVLAIMRQDRTAIEAAGGEYNKVPEEFTGRVFRSSYRKANRLIRILDEKQPKYLHYIQGIITE